MAKLNINLFKETMDEFKDKIENDPFKAGAILRDQYPDEISEMLELLFWAKGAREVTLKVSQDSDDLLKVEILNRK
jgi:hypothetical protein